MRKSIVRAAIRMIPLALILAWWGKRRHRNAKLSVLIKRLLGHVAVRVLKIPAPQLVSGNGSVCQIPELLKQQRCQKPLIVTDRMLVSHGVVKPIADSLATSGVAYVVYDDVTQEPPSELVDKGYEQYKSQGCDSIIAVGGGSPMDVAKVIGAKVARPSPVRSYEGYFMVTGVLGLYSLPPLIAVPTTAGTGSETTVAAVISIKEERRKAVIADMGLAPNVAVLDPQLLVKLPKAITCATGMDALTHAIEAYLSGLARTFVRQSSLSATEKIFKNLVASYKDGANLDAREGMLLAAYKAGCAINNANVGYVHAIAHQFGGMFNIPHGTANAMVLPHVLEYYLQREVEGVEGFSCTTKLCELARAAGLADCNGMPETSTEKIALARKFISRIGEMNDEMATPTEVKGMRVTHLEEIATRALNEANGEQFSLFEKPIAALLDLGYAVPKYMTHSDCENIVSKLLPADERQKWVGKK